MKKSNIFIQMAIVFGIIVVVNLISEGLYFRLDFTEDKRYTLSKATKDMVSNLDEVITVKAYFTEELPPQLAYVRKDLNDLLLEYEDLSDGNVVFEFISPNESDELKQEAFENGIAPVSINVVENDQRQQLQAFMGVLFKSGTKTEVIPLVQPGASMEYDLTTSIKKISIDNKPKVGVIGSYGATPINLMPQLMQQLSVLYQPEPFNISSVDQVPSNYTSLIWVAPQDTLDLSDLIKLDYYLSQGGNVFIAYTSVKGDLQTGMLSGANDIGLASWLATKGLGFGEQFVIDAQCAAVSVRQQSGFFTINSQVEFPYFPRVSNFSEHPAVSGLEGLLLPFVNPIRIFKQDSALKITPLMYSSEKSGFVNAPAYVDIQRKWNQRDFPAGPQVLAASVEGIGDMGGKLIAIANSQFIVNGEGQQMQQLNPDNVNFASNAIDWLSDDTGLIELRTKGVTNRPLESVEDSTKNLLKYGNVLAPILIMVIYGFIRRGTNARKRQRWIQGNFN